MQFIYNDGGRKEAGYKGNTFDCVCRSIAIAAELPYKQVYEHLASGNATQRKSKHDRYAKRPRSAAYGINIQRKWFKDYMQELGFTWVPTMGIGTGCKVHLKADELPRGRLIVNVSKHTTAVIDGVLHDTYDCSREETRCVYGYYYKPDADILAYTAETLEATDIENIDIRAYGEEALERFASTLKHLKD